MALELLANPAKTEWTVRNLNKDPTYPYDDNSFDVVTNSLSADCLTSPLEVFREIRRVLKPGGLAAMAFTKSVLSLESSTVLDAALHGAVARAHHRELIIHYAGFDDEDISVVDVPPTAGWASATR